MLTIEELRQLSERRVFGAGGQYLGTIHEMYADNTADRPTFATVVGSGPGRAFIPLAQAVLHGDDVVVPYDAALLNAAPATREDGQLSPQEERRLYLHYGITEGVPAVSRAQPPTSRPSGMTTASDVPGPRLRKYVVSDAVAAPAPSAGRYRASGQSSSTTPAPAAQQAVEETAATAQDEAAETAHVASAAASDVAGTAKDQAQQVTSEAVEQARQLTGQARAQVGQQAGQATERLSEKVRGLAAEARDLSEGKGDGSGTVAGLAKQMADRGVQVADYLSRQGPDGLLRDVRAFAARRPGTFLLGTLAAGLVTGRVVKGATSSVESDVETGAAAGTPSAVPVVRPVPVDRTYPAETALPLLEDEGLLESEYDRPAYRPPSGPR